MQSSFRCLPDRCGELLGNQKSTTRNDSSRAITGEFSNVLGVCQGFATVFEPIGWQGRKDKTKGASKLGKAKRYPSNCLTISRSQTSMFQETGLRDAKA